MVAISEALSVKLKTTSDANAELQQALADANKARFENVKVSCLS